MTTLMRRPGAALLLVLGLALSACSGPSAAPPITTPDGTLPTAPTGLQLQNLGGVPGSDRLVFSRIGSLAGSPPNRVHDRETLRVRNVSTQAIQITELPVTGPWTVTPSPTAASPLTVPAGGQADVTVRFVAEGPATGRTTLYEGSLSVVSSAGRSSVQLAGLWQSQPEGGVEPSLDQVRRAFGFSFSLVNSGTAVGDSQVIAGLDHNGQVAPDGDEVLSPYWQRADPAQPVTVSQLAAFHTQKNPASLAWYPKGAQDARTILTSDGTSAQSVLPLIAGGTGPSAATFAPSDTFGLVVDGAEWSDPTLNRHRPDLVAGCAGPCGHHLRFWPVRASSGQPIPNTYFMGMDYAGINYDYQDNVYLISNLKPAPLLMNVGGPTFTAPSGAVWTADQYSYTDVSGAPQTYTYYSPSTAVSQPTRPTTVAILNTDNPQLYRTYRHNTLSTPLDQRTMTYTLPLNNGTYQVRLHFAELAWNSAGKRVFDVSVEGVPRLTNFDIWTRAGGQNTALVVPIDTVQVTGGQLTVQLKASVDFPNISGIEVSR